MIDTVHPIAYILGEYPSRTETFIANEINRIRAYTPLVIFALSGSGGRGAIYLPSLLSIQLALCHVREFLRHPGRYLSTLFDTIACRNGLFSISAFYKGVFFIPHILRLHPGHLHAHFAGFPTDVAMILSRMTGLRYSISAHAHDIYVTNERLLSKKIAEALFVVTCTRYNQTYLQRKHSLYQTKIHLGYHGIAVSEWPFTPVAYVSDMPIRLLAVGRLVEKKGFKDLLTAVHILTERGKTVQLDIVGEGPLRTVLENFCVQYSLSELVYFHGWLTQNQIRTLHHASAVLVQPSIEAQNGDRDGIPNVLLEAMASGLPIVATALSGIPELLTAHNSILIPPKEPAAIADAIVRLCEDIQFRNQIITNARETVLHFDMNLHIQTLYTLFRQYRIVP